MFGLNRFAAVMGGRLPLSALLPGAPMAAVPVVTTTPRRKAAVHAARTAERAPRDALSDSELYALAFGEPPTTGVRSTRSTASSGDSAADALYALAWPSEA